MWRANQITFSDYWALFLWWNIWEAEVFYFMQNTSIFFFFFVWFCCEYDPGMLMRFKRVSQILRCCSDPEQNIIRTQKTHIQYSESSWSVWWQLLSEVCLQGRLPSPTHRFHFTSPGRLGNVWSRMLGLCLHSEMESVDRKEKISTSCLIDLTRIWDLQ